MDWKFMGIWEKLRFHIKLHTDASIMSNIPCLINWKKQTTKKKQPNKKTPYDSVKNIYF